MSLCQQVNESTIARLNDCAFGIQYLLYGRKVINKPKYCDRTSEQQGKKPSNLLSCGYAALLSIRESKKTSLKIREWRYALQVRFFFTDER